MGSLMGNITQPCLGRLSPSWIFLFQSWEISALKMLDSSALCLVLCVESNLLLFGCYVLSSSLWPHGLQHAGSSVLHYLLELSPIHVHQLVMLTISSSASPFSFCLQYFPASECFPMSWLFQSGSQIIGTSASVLPKNIQGWFPLGLTGLILQSKELSRVFSSTMIQKQQLFGTQPSLWPNSHICI